MSTMKAQVYLAQNEADDALRWAKEGASVVNYVNDKRALEGLCHKTLCDCYLAKDQAADAKRAATDMLAAGQKYKDQDTIAGAWHSLASAYLVLDDESVENADEAAQKALSIFKELGHAKGTASVLGTVARISYAKNKAKDGVIAAEQAVEIWRDTVYSKDLATALDLLIQGCAMQDNPMQGLRAANHELATIRRNGNRKAEADLLEMLATTYAMLGEPVGAAKNAQAALEIFQALGDNMGVSNIYLLLSEMLRAQGRKAEATVAAENAEKAFKQLRCAWGEAQARETVSSLLVERGLPEKAPKRPDALKALQNLVKAIEKLNIEEFKAHEEKLNNEYMGLITDQDIEDTLQPMFNAQDPEVMAFLMEQGWKFKPPPGQNTMVKLWDHTMYYLNHIYGGMNFGPQFRHCYPSRVGTAASNGGSPFLMDKNHDKAGVAITCSQLEDTEGWQKETLYRLGPLDSFQILGVTSGNLDQQ